MGTFKRIVTLLWVIVAFAYGCGSASAQPTRAPSSLQTLQDLSDQFVFAILQDSKGFMWFGTADGLYRYDSHTLINYRHDVGNPQSLSDNHVYALHEDQNGTLWAGTRSGLDRFDPASQTFTHHSSEAVHAIHEDQTGEMWVAAEQGLHRFLPDDGALSLVIETDVTALYVDQTDVVWIGTSDGELNLFDPRTEELGPFTVIDTNLSGSAILAIHQDQANRLWVGTDGDGLYRINLFTGAVTNFRHDINDLTSLSSDVIWVLREDHLGTVWVGTAGGVNRLDPENECFVRYSQSSAGNDMIGSIYEDRSGLLWIGTLGGGVNRLPAGDVEFDHYYNLPGEPNSLINNMVTAIYEDRIGMLWVGTANGLDRFDRSSGLWTHYRHSQGAQYSLGGNAVGAINEDASGEIWIGTEAGLSRFDRETGRFHNTPHFPTDAIFLDEAGTFWVGADPGLYRFDPDGTQFTQVGFDTVTAIDEGPPGTLWVGTADNGLYRLDQESGTSQRYTAAPGVPNSLSDNGVTAVHVDPSGTVWVGTLNGGLNRFDPQAGIAIAHFREQDGLPSDSVAAILENERGDLWISTGGGLARFERQSEIFRFFTVRDWLQSNTFNIGAAHLSRSGEVFFGGSNGFNSFYPEDVTRNLRVPPVIITAFSLFDTVVQTDLAPDSHIELSYQDNTIAFDFAVLDYMAPAENLCGSILEGYDDEWTISGASRRAEYVDLPPGDYDFRVHCANNDGVWNEERVTVTITPPFWSRRWFQGVVVLALALATFGGYRLRVKRVESRSRELARQVEERTAELSQTNTLLKREIAERKRAEDALSEQAAIAAVVAERNRLARDLHDSVSQSLYGVTLYAETAARLLASGEINSAASYLQEMEEIAEDAQREMRRLIFELRPSALEKGGLVGALKARLAAVEQRAGMQTTLDIGENAALPINIEEEMYRIAQEALNNTLKHAQASAVTITIRNLEDTVVMEITDDGAGFVVQDTAKRGGIGLNAMRERAARIDGQLSVESLPGVGTRIRLEVKL
jgi:signal transduction histidine kinase/ligand-binding sensor domain-containing protein